MKKIYAIGFAALAAVPLAGCYTPEERAVGGALLGGATGAAIGAATTGRGSGAAVGAALGAASGAIIGANTAPVYRDPYYYPRPRPGACTPPRPIPHAAGSSASRSSIHGAASSPTSACASAAEARSPQVKACAPGPARMFNVR